MQAFRPRWILQLHRHRRHVRLRHRRTHDLRNDPLPVLDRNADADAHDHIDSEGPPPNSNWIPSFGNILICAPDLCQRNSGKDGMAIAWQRLVPMSLATLLLVSASAWSFDTTECGILCSPGQQCRAKVRGELVDGRCMLKCLCAPDFSHECDAISVLQRRSERRRGRHRPDDPSGESRAQRLSENVTRLVCRP